nr:TonB-dependent receptor [Gemmatimonadaceae bacterium]
ALAYDNNRDGESLSRTDAMVSPRAGLVIKPVEPVSVYASYSMSYLPSAGDQFASLNATTQGLEPEQFSNVELGTKWDVRPELSLAAAAYRLDRTNTRAIDPADPARSLQTGAQRTSGYEVTVTGRPLRGWEVAGGFAAQRATITRTTAAAPQGRTVPLVPATTFSLWNKVDLTGRLAAGVGFLHQGRSYAAIDNAVQLPAFTRTDAALYVTLFEGTRLQLNVENLFDTLYYATSHGNNNIMPGAPQSVRVSLVAGF